jgi:4-hydroxybenzoate polyprenyltransferase
VIDYLRMLRIGDWVRFYPIIPLVGALLAGATVGQLLLIFLIYFALIGYAFVVNNYCDVEIDRLHRKKAESNKNPLASGTVGRKGVQITMMLLVGVAIIGAAILSLGSGILGFSLVLLNLLLVTAYSGGPRLKDAPVLDIVTHGLMFGALPFLAGFTLARGNMTSEVLLLASLPFLLGCEALIAHQVVEYEMDIDSTKTTITGLGQRTGLLLLGVLTVASIVILLFIAPAVQLSPLALAAAGSYLLAYPVYSCRGIFNDIRHCASAQ